MIEEDLIKWYEGTEKESADEIEKRMALEAYSIHISYFAQNSDSSEKRMPILSKYGVDEFVSIRNIVIFTSIDDMTTAMSNEEFKLDFHKQYKVKTPKEYFVPNSLDGDWYEADIVFLNGEFFFRVSCLSPNNEDIFRWNVYQNSIKSSVKEVIGYYAAFDNLVVNEVQADNANTVFYVTSKNCEFFSAAGAWPSCVSTGYIWEQEGSFCVLIIEGEHKPENLEYCSFVKKDI